MTNAFADLEHESTLIFTNQTAVFVSLALMSAD